MLFNWLAMSKVYITNFFHKKYISKIKWFDLEKFSEFLKTKNHVNLKYPYLKFKFSLLWVSYRWVVLISKFWSLVPLILCLKKDKNCWDNIIWEKFEKQILKNQDRVLEDIEKRDFKVY